MLSPRRAVVILAAAALLAGCGDDWSDPHPATTAIGSPKPGFTDPSAPPTPESTVTPAPGSWDDVHPGKGYRVVLLTAGDDAATKSLASAVRSWADVEKVDLRTVDATGEHDLVPGITKAIGMGPELVISAGNDLVDPLTLVTASHLDQQFLVLGAEIPEPTGNVTAVGWPGASFRGEGLAASTPYDPATFTTDRAANATRAGVAAVLTQVTGIVLWLS
ncbi:hypothetical protein GCM10022223_56170 [Kineosporia mesophila]|uniref:BMP family ABC transporter substrate-binding protein n=1 Tax=Kineosporia mesophila TaxID=566012 RepID=A0ABP7AFW1_9ACTN|nr:hypothetical protein [Kineosporia mesophila]MCD5354362.1 hypothetical protein [Kineosporia mesophila]